MSGFVRGKNKVQCEERVLEIQGEGEKENDVRTKFKRKISVFDRIF